WDTPPVTPRRSAETWRGRTCSSVTVLTRAPSLTTARAWSTSPGNTRSRSLANGSAYRLSSGAAGFSLPNGGLKAAAPPDVGKRPPAEEDLRCDGPQRRRLQQREGQLHEQRMLTRAQGAAHPSPGEKAGLKALAAVGRENPFIAAIEILGDHLRGES